MSTPPRRVAAITGAGSGLGRALAIELARRGYGVAVSDINEVGAAGTVDQLQRSGAEAFAMHVDVTDPEAVAAWAEAIWARWGRCDVLVNNAGVAAIGDIGEVSLEDWRWCIEVDLFGVIHGCHAFVPRLKAQGSGHVINIASIAAYALAPWMGPYNVAKAGVVALSETLRAECAPHGVKVTVVCPAFFKTRLPETMRSANSKLGERARRLVEDADLSAESVAASIADAIQHNRPYVIEPELARLMFLARRLFPARATEVVQWVTSRVRALR